MTTERGNGDSVPAGEARAPRQSAAPSAESAGSRGRPVPWLIRRIFPLLAAVVLTAVGVAVTIWYGPRMVHVPDWALPDDLWGTLTAAQRLVHLNLGGLYTEPTALITFPGAAVILVPIVAVIDAAGISLQLPGPDNTHPAAWLLAGPYQVLLSSVVLFAADAIAEHLGVTKPKRAFLAAAGAVVLWNVSVRWGHPEDALAVALLLYGILALSRSGRTARSAWLIGAAVAVQPLVLLALPFVLVLIEPRRLAGFLARAATPATVLLAAAAAANWTATVKAVTSQPNSPIVDHPTPWTSLAPQLSHNLVATGPARVLTVLIAGGCALALRRRWRSALASAGWSPELVWELLWWVAVALALRSVLEPVMVAFYLWPPLAVALIPAARRWWRLVPASLAAGTITFVSQNQWRGPWGWWSLMVAGLVVTLFFAGVPRRTFPFLSGTPLRGSSGIAVRAKRPAAPGPASPRALSLAQRYLKPARRRGAAEPATPTDAVLGGPQVSPADSGGTST
jgi:hypothetical protein